MYQLFYFMCSLSSVCVSVYSYSEKRTRQILNMLSFPKAVLWLLTPPEWDASKVEDDKVTKKTAG